MVSRFFTNGTEPGGSIEISASFAGLRFDKLNQVRAYWEALRDDDHPPLRSQLDPRGIEDALANSFLLERVAPRIARFRIAGMHLTDLMGMDVRGMPVSTFFEPSGRSRLGEELESVFTDPALMEMALEADRGVGRPTLDARLLVLPLRADDGQCNLALGSLVTAGQIGRSPRRFHIRRSRITTITSRPPAGVSGKKMEHGLSEPAACFSPPRAKPGQPHLRLIKTDL